MTLQDEYVESTNPSLQSRVQMSTLSAAQAISTEAVDTPNHANRISLAQQVVRSPDALRVGFTNLLCAEGITSQSTDAEIDTMVSSVWNTMAGQPPAPV
jgi:hypothetical protein